MGGTTWRDTSTVNTRAARTSANLAIVPLNTADDTIRIRNANGASHVVADVQGFIVPDGQRVHDGAHPGAGARHPRRRRQRAASCGPAGVLSVPVRGLPTNATAVAVTITAVDATKAAFVRATGAGDTASQVSNVNVRAGDTRANLAIVPVGPDGRITITVNDGEIDVVADVSGWFAPPPPTRQLAP